MGVYKSEEEWEDDVLYYRQHIPLWIREVRENGHSLLRLTTPAAIEAAKRMGLRVEPVEGDWSARVHLGEEET